jgi:hypothetical protein
MRLSLWNSWIYGKTYMWMDTGHAWDNCSILEASARMISNSQFWATCRGSGNPRFFCCLVMEGSMAGFPSLGRHWVQRAVLKSDAY